MYRKLRKQRHHADGHVVDHGNVGCPRRRRDVDIEFCYVCPAFEDVVTDGDVTYLYCRPRATVGGFDTYTPF